MSRKMAWNLFYIRLDTYREIVMLGLFSILWGLSIMISDIVSPSPVSSFIIFHWLQTHPGFWFWGLLVFIGGCFQVYSPFLGGNARLFVSSVMLCWWLFVVVALFLYNPIANALATYVFLFLSHLWVVWRTR